MNFSVLQKTGCDFSIRFGSAQVAENSSACPNERSRLIWKRFALFLLLAIPALLSIIPTARAGNRSSASVPSPAAGPQKVIIDTDPGTDDAVARSEEHTPELQSPIH